MILSPRKSSDPSGGPFEKPTTDLYTVLLIIALLAMVVCVLYLYAEMATYEFKLKGGAMWTDGPASTAIAGKIYLPSPACGRGVGGEGGRNHDIGLNRPHPSPLRAPTEGWSGEGTMLSA